MERRVAPRRLTTARLVGEALGPEHAAGILAIRADPRVAAWMAGALDAARVAAFTEARTAAWERDGFGYWAWRLADGDDIVAHGGLARTPVDGAEEIEVAWTVASAHWGKGLATELGAASVEVAFSVLGLPALAAFTQPHNAASRRVMEKLGFAYEKDVTHAGLPHVLYRLRAPR